MRARAMLMAVFSLTSQRDFEIAKLKIRFLDVRANSIVW
jgi:hypothetical protein